MFCAHCGNQFATESNFCSACGASGVRAAYAAQQTRIVRPRHPRMIAGVCSGIAIYNGWDVSLLRILVVIATILTGGAVLIGYLTAWLLIPDALYALPPNARPTT